MELEARLGEFVAGGVDKGGWMPFMEYYGAERSNRVDAHLATLMDLINIMLSNSIV